MTVDHPGAAPATVFESIGVARFISNLNHCEVFFAGR
jgi:hypothetical protein